MFKIFAVFTMLFSCGSGYAQDKIETPPNDLGVEWFQPEIEIRSDQDLTLIISGMSASPATISIDLENIVVISGGKNYSNTDLRLAKAGASGATTRTGSTGYFELSIKMRPGLAQVPIIVRWKNGKTRPFLITFDVKPKNVEMSAKITKKLPPQAEKKLRLWAGLGSTYQSYSQTVQGSTVSFYSVASPSLLFRAGYWGPRFGVDAYYRSAPGTIKNVQQPFLLQNGSYSWQTIELRGLYNFPRSPTSRLFGVSSQLQLYLGLQDHATPYLDINTSNVVNLVTNTIFMGTVGLGIILARERDWSFEGYFDLQEPVYTSGSGGNTLSVSSVLAGDARVGANYKFAPNWRFGIFTYLQTHNYNFTYTNNTTNTVTSGNQSLFYSTFDLHLGYEN